jgi:hypothetical protein
VINPTITPAAFTALLLNGVVFAIVALAGAAIFSGPSTSRHRWIIGPLTIALCGYAVFWCGFFHPLAGRIASWFVLVVATTVLGLRWKLTQDLARLAAPVVLGTTLFVFAATALLVIYPGASFATTAQGRFFAGMPGDNDIPRLFADIIRGGGPAQKLGGDWLTSDRPPLQTGLALLTWPILSVFGINLDIASATAGVWFQALWFPSVWMLLRSLGLASRAALGVATVLGGTGMLVFNTVYVWPKLGAAAFVVAAFVLWLRRDRAESPAAQRVCLAVAVACAMCGWLAHGGVMFSLLALGPLVIADALRRPVRHWLLAAGVVALLAGPWLLYQKLYASPGNRLIKWHLAGVVPPDARGVGQTLRDQYHAVGWRGAWEARKRNFSMLFAGDWREPFNPWANASVRRSNDVAFPLHTASAWTLGLAALAWLLCLRPRLLREHARVHLLTSGWLLGGVIVWVALMFSPDSVFTHQGSFVTQVLLLTLLAAWTWLAGRIFFALVAAVQWIGFFTTWVGPSAAPHGLPDGLAVSVAVACGAGLLALAGWQLTAEEPNAPIKISTETLSTPPAMSLPRKIISTGSARASRRLLAATRTGRGA